MMPYEDIVQNFEERRPESRRTSRSTAGSHSEVEDFIADSDEDESDNDNQEIISDSDAPKRKSKRSKNKKKKQPKAKEVVEPTRRSSRATKPTASYGVEGTSEPEDQPEEESEDEMEAPQTRKASKSNKQVISLTWNAKKTNVIDLGSDEEEEEEAPVSALLTHRSVRCPLPYRCRADRKTSYRSAKNATTQEQMSL